VPDVVESDSDTAWGLWEHSLQAGEDHGKVPSGDGAYDETLPAPLSELAKINRRPPG
jgi:hypothetical protein